jgi:hypothetical protein
MGRGQGNVRIDLRDIYYQEAHWTDLVQWAQQQNSENTAMDFGLHKKIGLGTRYTIMIRYWNKPLLLIMWDTIYPMKEKRI